MFARPRWWPIIVEHIRINVGTIRPGNCAPLYADRAEKRRVVPISLDFVKAFSIRDNQRRVARYRSASDLHTLLIAS